MLGKEGVEKWPKISRRRTNCTVVNRPANTQPFTKHASQNVAGDITALTKEEKTVGAVILQGL